MSWHIGLWPNVEQIFTQPVSVQITFERIVPVYLLTQYILTQSCSAQPLYLTPLIILTMTKYITSLNQVKVVKSLLYIEFKKWRILGKNNKN